MDLPNCQRLMNGFPLQPLAALKWLAQLTLLAIAVGCTSAFFLWALTAVTLVRFAHPGLLLLLPIAGLGVGVINQRYGRSASGGNNLLMDEIHQPGAGVPRRMAPLILGGTLVTHLFGGSAGREGTALQIGGSIAATFARLFKLTPAPRRLLLMAGIAAGFGSIFGTPIAGAVFATEVLIVGRIQYDALIPCLISALLADWTCRAWGTEHTHYCLTTQTAIAPLNLRLIANILLVASTCGLASRLFTTLSHRFSHAFQTYIPRAELRPVVGGLIVIGLFFLSGSTDYLGLGVLGNRADAVTLPHLFTSTTVPASAWLWKLLFTVITLSAGFKGGEVTPLFFIGAALGNFMALTFGAPLDLMAALGFVAIFAAATKTPLASTFLGIELFGLNHSLYLATACLIAYHCSGRGGIYPAQRLQ